jgi:hypothetical protein
MTLYKYFTPERIDVLSKARIRFTQPNALNDPFELKPFFRTTLNPATFRDNIRKRLDLPRALRDKYDHFPQSIKDQIAKEKFVAAGMLIAERRKEEFDRVFEQELDRFDKLQPALAERLRAGLHHFLGNDIGILSLSETPTNDQMWALYAAERRGFLIGFDDAHPFFHAQRSENDEFYHLRKVSYLDHRLNFESLEELAEAEIFTTKLSSWSFEREWRMLIPFLGRNPEISEPEPIHLITIPRASIRSLIFGDRAGLKLKDSVKEILSADPEYRHVSLLSAGVDLERGTISLTQLPK